jgi:hypothetical protein
MALNCLCPLPSALPTVGNSTCAFDIDQVIRLAFQMPQDSAPFADATAIATQSNWTSLLSAVDATKMLVSPFTVDVTIPASEGAFEGGDDNSTVDGLPLYKGENTVTVEGMFKSVAPSVLKQLKELSCFSLSQVGSSKLTVFLLTGKNEVVSMDDFKGITINNFRIGSRGSEGYRASDMISFSFNMTGYWDDTIDKTTLNFNPRDLTNAEAS